MPRAGAAGGGPGSRPPGTGGHPARPDPRARPDRPAAAAAGGPRPRLPGARPSSSAGERPTAGTTHPRGAAYPLSTKAPSGLDTLRCIPHSRKLQVRNNYFPSYLINISRDKSEKVSRQYEDICRYVSKK